MPRPPRPNPGRPRSYAADRSAWPDTPMIGARDLSPYLARDFAQQLSAALRGRDLIEVAEKAGMPISVLLGLRSGNRWPAMPLVGQLSVALDVPMWPSDARTAELWAEFERDRAAAG